MNQLPDWLQKLWKSDTSSARHAERAWFKTQWKDMDSAPKDGTEILIKDEEGNCICSWGDSQTGTGSKESMRWCIVNDWDEEIGYNSPKNPIGWMHLPE